MQLVALLAYSGHLVAVLGHNLAERLPVIIAVRVANGLDQRLAARQARGSTTIF